MMKRRIIYFTVMLFTAVLFFSCSDMLSELNGKKKTGTTNGEPLSIELTAGKPQKNGDNGQKLTVTVAVSTDSEVKKVVWKKDGTQVAKRLLEDENAFEAGATNDNRKWTFEITAANETEGNGKYTVAVLDGAGRRETEQITIAFDFTKPPAPVGTEINADYPSATEDTSIKLTWSEPDESEEPNYDHAEITLTYTQDDGNPSDPVTKTVNKGTTDYIFKQTDLPEDKKQEYTFTVKYVDTVGNESDPCTVTATKYTLTYPTDGTGANTATKTVLVKDGDGLRTDQLPPALPDTKDHYFAGWYDISDSTKTLIKEGSRLTGDVTLASKWVKGRALTESVKVLSKDEYTGTAGEATDKIIYVEFGDWPQTIKAAGVTVSETTTIKQGMFTYCLGSDGEWYVEQAEWALSSDYKYSDGSNVGTGGKSKKWFKVEPIKWRVLTDNYDGKKLLLAESVLASGIPYCSDSSSRTIGGVTVYANNYKYSTIRAWLNGKYEPGDTQAATYDGKGFLQSAFTSAQASAIADTTFDNSLVTTLPDNYESLDYNKKRAWNDGVNQYASDSPMGDKIFLLSEKDVSTSGYGFGAYYYTNNSNRVRAATDFAKATGVLDMYASSYWWLRSPYWNNENNALRVKDDGDAGRNYGVNSADGGIVPALSISAQ